MQRRRIAVATAFVALLVSSQSSESQTLGRRLAVRKYGFSVESPSGWRVVRDGVGLPLYFNFKGVEMLGKGLLPIGGATINTVAWNRLPRRRGDDSLGGWAQVDAAVAIKDTLSNRHLDLPESAAAQNAVFSDYDVATYGPDDQRQHCTSIYWEFRGKFFATHLVYLAGDPSASSYMQTLVKTVGSIRPI